VNPQLITTTEAIDAVFFYILGISLLLFIGVTGTMVFFVVKYHRKRHPEPTSDVQKHLGLEITWTIVPTLIALSMFWYGWQGYIHLSTVPENAMEVDVTGRMWSWSFEYENGKTSDRLYVPVNTPVKVDIHSTDVLHSFYIPAFRVKKDAVPGMTTYVWFTAPDIGSYDIFCAEYCGVGHSSMITTVEVLTRDEFREWYEKEPAAESRGRDILSRNGCLGCHSLDGSSGIGPTFQGLYGSSRTVLIDGEEQTVTADEDYLRRSILEPNAELVKGFQPMMPSYEGKIPEEDMEAIISFMQEISEEEGLRGGPESAGQEETAKPEETAQPGEDEDSKEQEEEQKQEEDVDVEALLQEKGCTGCHSLDGTRMVGPTFKGLFGKETTILRNGEEITLTADADYIKRSIQQPQAEVVKGYPPVMPPSSDLSEEQMEAIVRFLEALK